MREDRQADSFTCYVYSRLEPDVAVSLFSQLLRLKWDGMSPRFQTHIRRLSTRFDWSHREMLFFLRNLTSERYIVRLIKFRTNFPDIPLALDDQFMVRTGSVVLSTTPYRPADLINALETLERKRKNAADEELSG